MELIIINENKLKILMTDIEMKEYGLDENEFHLCISDTRKILSKILHNSPIKTGFEFPSPHEKILLQLYPEKKGGCELYVTKLNIENEKIGKEDGIMNADESHLLPISTKQRDKNKKPLICYCFKELSTVINLCKIMNTQKIQCNSSLHVDDNGKYYMVFSTQDCMIGPQSSLGIISEFGELTNVENTLLFLSERGKIICEKDAIETLSKL